MHAQRFVYMMRVYTVRTAVNATNGAINSTKNAVVGTQQAIGYVGDKCIELKDAIDKASEQSTSLGNKIFYLNCILTVATALATAFAIISFFTGNGTTNSINLTYSITILYL